MTARCSRCGAEYSEGVNYCDKCGVRVIRFPLRHPAETDATRRSNSFHLGRPNEQGNSEIKKLIELRRRYRAGAGALETEFKEYALALETELRKYREEITYRKKRLKEKYLEDLAGFVLAEPNDQTPSRAVEEPKMRRRPEDSFARARELDKDREPLRIEANKGVRRSPGVAGLVMAGVGTVSLILSLMLTSTVLAFVGLGLAFWGALLLFIRPRGYVRSDLMDSAALSSLRSIDRVITELGHKEKGIYIPARDPKKTVVFIPSGPLDRIPRPEEIENQTFVNDPKGIALVPPGLALANLAEREIGDLSKWRLENLNDPLRKVLVDDLEMVQDFEMQVNGNNVRFRFVEPVYSGFCRKLKGSTAVCSSLGCPFCSAMACLVAQVSGRPVEFDRDNCSVDGRTVESAYHILQA